MKQNYLKSFCARCLTLLILALLSTNLAWGTDYTELFTVKSDDVVTNSSYAKYETTVDNRGWIITFGGNNKSVGTNSNSRSNCKLSNYSKYAVYPVTTSDVAPAFVSTASISDVSKISYTFNGGSNQTNTNVYLIYSSDGNTFSQMELTSGIQGATISSGTEYEFTKCSGYFGLLFKATNSSGNWRIDDVNITFCKESDTPSKELVSIAISGTPTKTTYKEGESFDPTGLVVTGTYDDHSEEPITSGIEWTVTPAGALTVGTTSVEVTAKVGDIESDPIEVTGLTVTQFVQTYANTYTSNVTLSTVGGTSASEVKVRIKNIYYDALKCGTSSAAGACVVTIPANTKTLHFHAAGWNGETVTLTVNEKKFNLAADAGVASNSPFALENDPETNDYFTIDTNNEEELELTFAVTSGKRFVLFGVNAEPFKAQDVTISDAGWATACLPFNATITNGNAIAYYVTGTDGTALTKVEANVIPAGEGVLLKSNDGGAATVTFTETAVAADEVKANYMKGSVAGETFDESGYKYYILANGGKGLGFYYQGADNTTGSSVTCAAGKAVLAVPETAGAKAFFSLDDEPTGITSYENDNENENLKAMTVYNLNGMKVNNIYKGIVIMNGKKYINK